MGPLKSDHTKYGDIVTVITLSGFHLAYYVKLSPLKDPNPVNPLTLFIWQMSESGPSGGSVSVEVDAQDPIAINEDNFIDDEESDQVRLTDAMWHLQTSNHPMAQLNFWGPEFVFASVRGLG